jgi:hypothetical protein
MLLKTGQRFSLLASNSLFAGFSANREQHSVQGDVPARRQERGHPGDLHVRGL